MVKKGKKIHHVAELEPVDESSMLEEVKIFEVKYTTIGMDMAQFIARSIDNKTYKDNYRKISLLAYCEEYGQTYLNLTKEGHLISRNRNEDKNCAITISEIKILSEIHTQIEDEIRNTKSIKTNILWLDDSKHLVISFKVKSFYYMRKMGFIERSGVDISQL